MMALCRNIHTSFWTDTKVADDFTAEDKYFMLYCLTNPYTNIIGCYEVSIRQIANDLGYSKDSVESLLKRFAEHHDIIEYDSTTKELWVKNWYKYNWTASPKLDPHILNAIKSIKSDKFRGAIIELYNSRDTVSIPYQYPIDTVTNAISNSITNTATDIISYLNSKLGTKYTINNKVTIKHIKARINEGYTVEDFYKVIDNMYAKWKGTDMEMYLRPRTLFDTKFEDYLNVKISKGKTQQVDDSPADKYADLLDGGVTV